MKGLAAIGAAGLIAAAGALWFATNPAVVVTKVEPLRPSSEWPTFKQVEREALKPPSGR
jgi:hypothetical protein